MGAASDAVNNFYEKNDFVSGFVFYWFFYS